jgi:hypothetical protein
MEPCEFLDPIFIVDLNELQCDGVHIQVAMDFTLNAGPHVRSSLIREPQIGDCVRIHSDEDDTLYFATVVKKVSDRDYIVRIDWESCSPVLNRNWSSRVAGGQVLRESQTIGNQAEKQGGAS